MQYKLKYLQPYERDYDSPSGIGDHCIERQECVCTFEAPKDEEAKKIVNQFLSEGGVLFDHYLDGDGLMHYRLFVSLTCTREVPFRPSHPSDNYKLYTRKLN